MEALCHSPRTNTFNIVSSFPLRPHKLQSQLSYFGPNTIKLVKISGGDTKKFSKLDDSSHQHGNIVYLSGPCVHSQSIFSARSALSLQTASSATVSEPRRHWIVVMKRPPEILQSQAEILNYYVETLQKAISSEMDAQRSIYDTSCDKHYGFCCSIDEEASKVLAGLPGVLSVRRDPDITSEEKDYSFSNIQVDRSTSNGSTLLFPDGKFKQWIVRMDKSSVGVVSKAQMVDFYAQTLVKVLGNEEDAQMCMYRISWQSNFEFYCVLDDECAQELRDIPGVLSVQPDDNLMPENKDYGGDDLIGLSTPAKIPGFQDSTDMNMVHPKKLFITGLSFYTSEKTLREFFEPFGVLLQAEVIMDKISKRSKGYAFIEYASEEAATAALKEMNGKIINGWMIVVDRAKSKSGYSRTSSRPSAR